MPGLMGGNRELIPGYPFGSISTETVWAASVKPGSVIGLLRLPAARTRPPRGRRGRPKHEHHNSRREALAPDPLQRVPLRLVEPPEDFPGVLAVAGWRPEPLNVGQRIERSESDDAHVLAVRQPRDFQRQSQ
jgi:hypothetical protein